MVKMEEVVHIRYIPKGNKYQMIAPLNVIIKDVEIHEDIIVECHGTQTVKHLLEQAKESIKSIIQELGEQNKQEKQDELEEHDKLGEQDELGEQDKLKTTSEDIKEVKEETKEVEIYFKRMRQVGYKMIPGKITLCVIMSQNHEKTRLQIFDKEYPVLVNVPKIFHLSLPTVMYAPFSVCPAKFEGLGIKNTNCKFTWYRSKDKIDWEKVDGNYFYAIKKEDIGYYLKMACIPVSKENIEGTCVEVLSKGVILKYPEIPQCPFELRHEYTSNKLSGPSFRIVSYNILSSRYTHYNDEYSYCPDEYLSIDYRKGLFLKEILGYNADIICLQEVDILEYYRFLEKAFKLEGYLTKFYRKGYYLTEGMMCAVRQSRFKLKSYEQIVFCNALKKKKKIYKRLFDILREDESLYKKFLVQSQCMIVLTLKCKDRKILVGNIHLSHHPQNDDMRLIHSYMAIRYLNYRKQKMEDANPNCKVNIILCGDFNSLPNSAACDFILNGKLKRENYLKVSANLLNLEHTLKLKSACGTPKYTTYTPTFKDCIDYIFVEEEMTEIGQVVPFPEEELEEYSGIPNQVYPSDHLASVVDITFRE